MKKIKKSKIIGVGIFIIATVVFVYIYKVQGIIIQEKNAKLMEMKEKVESEKNINSQLNKKKEALNSDEYTEKIAREKLGMVKAGEKVFKDVGK